MLALTRKKGESIVINNNIEISVLEIRGDQIKIGVSAPKDVPIYRKEVYLQIQEETKESMKVDGLEALQNLFWWWNEKRVFRVWLRNPFLIKTAANQLIALAERALLLW